MIGEETSWSEDTLCPDTLPEHIALAKTLPGVKQCVCQKPPAEDKTHWRAKTLPKDRSGEDTQCHEDTWACDDTSGGHRRAKTLPKDESSEHTRCREDTWEDTSRRQVSRGHASTRARFKTVPEDAWSEDRRDLKRQCALKCTDVFLLWARPC